MALVAGLVRSVSKTARFTVRLSIIQSRSVNSDAIFNIETKNEKNGSLSSDNMEDLGTFI